MSSKYDPYLVMVNRLTNWQRSQWARAGYPGTHDHDPEQVAPFFARIKGAV